MTSPFDAALVTLIQEQVRAAVREELRASPQEHKKEPPRQESSAALLTVAEVAQRCHAHPVTVRAWIKSRRLKATKPAGHYLVRPGDLEAFLSQQSTPAPIPDADAEAERVLNSLYGGGR